MNTVVSYSIYILLIYRLNSTGFEQTAPNQWSSYSWILQYKRQSAQLKELIYLFVLTSSA